MPSKASLRDLKTHMPTRQAGTHSLGDVLARDAFSPFKAQAEQQGGCGTQFKPVLNTVPI